MRSRAPSPAARQEDQDAPAAETDHPGDLPELPVRLGHLDLLKTGAKIPMQNTALVRPLKSGPP